MTDSTTDELAGERTEAVPIAESAVPDNAVSEAVETSESDEQLAERLKAGRDEVMQQLHQVIIGQEDVLEEVFLTLMVGGNSIITGVPGLAKTLIVQTVAEILDLDFSRIQFTPDLMPADITGTDIIQEDPDSGQRTMEFMPGPIFSQIVLADEINRTPPKTQAALLEAMQEHRVTVQGKTYELDKPFFVFATQNPIELEGTYPLPEASSIASCSTSSFGISRRSTRSRSCAQPRANSRSLSGAASKVKT